MGVLRSSSGDDQDSIGNLFIAKSKDRKLGDDDLINLSRDLICISCDYDVPIRVSHRKT